MATPPPSQRAYRAACPNCGAPVEFRSAAAPFAVCGFCHSTVVRAGDQLRKIGESAGQGGGVVGDAIGLGAGVALGQTMANQLSQGLNAAAPGAPAAAAGAAAAAGGVKPEDVMATLERLADFKAKGILTQEEFDAKKAELLKKLA